MKKTIFLKLAILSSMLPLFKLGYLSREVVFEDKFFSIDFGHNYSSVLVDTDKNIDNGFENLKMWGRNDFNQLGNGDSKNLLIPTDIKIPTSKRIISNFIDFNFSGVLVDLDNDISNGGEEIWMWGDNTYGQIGDGSVEKKTTPVKTDLTNVINSDSKHIISKNIIGSNHSGVLVDVDDDISNGGEEIWMWGSNKRGQLGIPGSTQSRERPAKINVNDITDNYSNEMIDLYLSDKNTAVLVDTDDNISNGGEEIWMWGDNAYGQIGIGSLSQSFVNTPTKVDTTSMLPDSNKHIISLSLSEKNASALVDTDNNPSNGGEELWIWGDNNYGQLGNGNYFKPGDKDDLYSTTPYKVNLPITSSEHINSYDISYNNAGALITSSSESKIYLWGDNTYGQIGDGTKDFLIRQATPKLIDLPFDDTEKMISEISLGENHSGVIIVNRDLEANLIENELYVWGNNLYGQLGNGTNTESLIPQKVEIEKIIKDNGFNGTKIIIYSVVIFVVVALICLFLFLFFRKRGSSSYGGYY